MPWHEAKVFCEMQGGSLAVTEDADEHAIIADLLQEGGRPWYFLGAEREDGSWNWLDGTTVPSDSSVTAWRGEWRRNYLMMYRDGGDWVGLRHVYYPIKSVKKLGFVCELELAPPSLDAVAVVDDRLTFSVSNNYQAIPYTAIVCLYKDGRATWTTFEQGSREDQTFVINLPQENSANSVKLFLLNAESFTPLNDAVSQVL